MIIFTEIINDTKRIILKNENIVKKCEFNYFKIISFNSEIFYNVNTFYYFIKIQSLSQVLFNEYYSLHLLYRIDQLI